MNIQLKKGEVVGVHLLRRNGALVKVFTDPGQAERYMRKHRLNGEFWRIHPSNTEPHEEVVCDLQR